MRFARFLPWWRVAGTAALLCGCARTPTVWNETDEWLAPPPTQWEEDDWQGRRLPHDVTVSFEQIRGWRIAPPSAPVRMERRIDEPWTDGYACRLVWTSRPPSSVLTLTTDRAEVGSPFDTVELWARHHGASATSVQLVLASQDEVEYRIELGTIGTNWTLLRKTVLDAFKPAEIYPLELRELRLESHDRSVTGEVRLADLSFYNRRYDRLRLEPRPSLPDGMRRPELMGRFTGPGVLPYPLSGAPFRSDETSVTGAVQQLSEYLFEWSSSSPEASFAYRFDPRYGLKGVHVLHEASGPVYPFGAPGSNTHRTLSLVRHTADRVTVEYENGRQLAAVRVGRSLRVDVFSTREQTELHIGPWQTGDPAVPCRPLPLRNPVLAAFLQPTVISSPSRMYGSVWVDWRYSNASRWLGNEETGGLTARYAIDDGGRRPLLAERLWVTVSPHLEWTLPSIPMPSYSERRPPLDRVWSDVPQSEYAQAFPGVMRSILDRHTVSACGVVESEYAEAWRQWTARVDRAFRPDPAQADWNDVRIRLERDGNWARLSANRFALKPAFYRSTLMTHRPPRIPVEPGLAYAPPPLLAQAPWEVVDYDARTPGAATFAASILASADALDLLRARKGPPVLLRGPAAWMYAGLVPAWRAGRAIEVPPSPADLLFVLMSVNPVCAVYDRASADPEQVALRAAYGRAGALPPPTAERRSILRSFFFALALQPRTLYRAPDRVAQWEHDEWIDLGGPETRSDTPQRLYIRYAGQAECWINLGSTDWTVGARGADWTLPPFGLLCLGPDLLAFSGRVDGRPVDVVETDPFFYYDGHGSPDPFRGVSSPQPVGVMRKPLDDARAIVFGEGGMKVDTTHPDRPAALMDILSSSENAQLALQQPPGVYRWPGFDRPWAVECAVNLK